MGLNTNSILRAIIALLFGIAATLAQNPAGSPPPNNEIDLKATPKLLGEGIISTSLSESRAAFTRDMSRVYFGVSDRAFTRMTIAFSRFVNGKWQQPEIAPFSGLWNDSDPTTSADGTKLFFLSDRPVSGNQPRKDLDLWYVLLDTEAGLTNPIHLSDKINTAESETSPSVALNGNFYFSRAFDIYRAKLVNGEYEQPEKLPLTGNSAAIAPDESFIIYRGVGSSNADGDLFISFYNNGSWSPPQRLAAPVNTRFNETAPSFSPDGKHLYFASERALSNNALPARSKRLSSYADLRAELQNMVLNGLRNIYEVDLVNLRQASNPK